MVASSKGGTTLTSLKPGVQGIVDSFSDHYIGGKLLSMGILPGSKVEIVRKSPLGGSIYTKVNNSLVALRKEEAACIMLR
jgi:ferrous iron transport protein A